MHRARGGATANLRGSHGLDDPVLTQRRSPTSSRQAAGPPNGEENGDLCAWKTAGAGKAQDITLTTGKFAVQGTWSNLANRSKGGCAIKNAIVT